MSLKYHYGIFLLRGPIWYFSKLVNAMLSFYLMNKTFPLCFLLLMWYNIAGKFQACGFLISSHGRAVSGEIELQDNVYSNDDYIETASLLEQVGCNISSLIYFSFRLCLGVWRGGEGKRRLWRVRNIGENGKIFHIFWKSNLLENDKLMLMIDIFLIVRIIHRLNLKNSCKPSKTPQNPPLIQFLSSSAWGGFCIMKKNEPPKASPSQCHLFFPPAPSFFSKPLRLFPSKLANKALVSKVRILLLVFWIYFIH